MGKIRDLFKKKKKIRDTKGTFHAKMGSIKDRNGMGITEAECIKKRWQEYTEELSGELLLSSVSSLQRFEAMDIKALCVSQLSGLGQTVL